MKLCVRCNKEPTLNNNLLVHKCKNVSVVISDISVKLIIDKWNKFQFDNYKNIYATE